MTELEAETAGADASASGATAPGATESPRTPTPSAEPRQPESGLDTLPSLCPYLGTLDGNWRRSSVAAEHRCTAVSPPVQLAPEKQRRLCLVDAHVNCATYVAALAASEPAGRLVSSSRPIARMTPVILDQGRFDLHMPALRADRPTGQAVLVGLLGIALVAILLARPTGDSGGVGPLAAGTSASPGVSAGSPTAAAVAEPTDSQAAVSEPPAATEVPSASPEPSSAPSAAASSAAPTSSASASPPPSAEPSSSGATYKVKSGDNLYKIAAHFGTTINVLIKLNDIVDPSKLHVGQVLLLP